MSSILHRRLTRRRPIAVEHDAPSATDNAMMTRALELAQQAAEAGEVPVGAVLYHPSTGQIIAEAANTRETRRDPLGHAECLVIRDAALALGDWRLNDWALAVTLEPCPMCAGAIVNARVGRVVYGADDPKAGACRSIYALTTDPRLNHRVQLVPGVQAEASAALLRAFFRTRRTRRG